MKLKVALVSALLLAPSVGLAMGCSKGNHDQAMSCAEGTTYDDESKTCLPVST